MLQVISAEVIITLNVNDHEVTNANPFSFALDDMTFVNIYNDSNSNSPWKVVIELESEREKINSFNDKV